MADSTEGERISQARRRLGFLIHRDIGQPELARLVGVSSNTVVWNWETDTKSPSDVNRRQLSRVLGVTEAYLRYGTEPMELPGWTAPDLSVLDLPAQNGADARTAIAKKPNKKRRGA